MARKCTLNVERARARARNVPEPISLVLRFPRRIVDVRAKRSRPQMTSAGFKLAMASGLNINTPRPGDMRCREMPGNSHNFPKFDAQKNSTSSNVIKLLLSTVCILFL